MSMHMLWAIFWLCIHQSSRVAKFFLISHFAEVHVKLRSLQSTGTAKDSREIQDQSDFSFQLLGRTLGLSSK